MVYSRAKISDENAVMQDGNWPKTNGCVFDAFCIGGGGGHKGRACILYKIANVPN